jgi:hypothetical protein
MSIIEEDKLDLIGDNDNDKSVNLGISDHLDWKDVEDHLDILQKKINSYLNFIESGQLHTLRPNSVNKKINIEVIAKYPIPETVIKKYYTKITKQLEDAGYGFKYQELAE